LVGNLEWTKKQQPLRRENRSGAINTGERKRPADWCLPPMERNGRRRGNLGEAALLSAGAALGCAYRQGQALNEKGPRFRDPVSLSLTRWDFDLGMPYAAFLKIAPGYIVDL
jgi:hypothetical protein